MTHLQTFNIPKSVVDSESNRTLGKAIVAAWKKDGILQVARTSEQDEITRQAYAANREFFSLPMSVKKSCVSDLTYSGYVAIGEEKKGGDSGDFPEVLTLFDDIPLDDPRVKMGLPGHGPIPWPNAENISSIRARLDAYKDTCTGIGHRMLQLTALGLDWDMDSITQYTNPSWNYMRVLKFPASSTENQKGIGAHTDYDFLVISSQDEDKSGLFIRPPVEGEKRYRNWMTGESMRGQYERVDPWNLIEPVPSVFTVFPADMMQLLTDGELLSTPHKVSLYEVERCSIPVFIGPDYMTTLRPHGKPQTDAFHYGIEMTKRHMEMYPERVTTKRIIAENRLSTLEQLVEIRTSEFRKAG